MPRFSALFLAGCVLIPDCSSEPPECAVDGDCQPGLYCRQNECVFDCTHDGECHEGFRCTARGRCERGCSPTNGGVEICDGVDNDCDGETDEGLLNRCGECEPPDEDLVDLCEDGLDNDCDGETDEGYANLGLPCSHGACVGVWVCSADRREEVCNALEPGDDDAQCDGIDEDCDGETDEDVLPRECPLQAGVCAGIQDVCLVTGSWSGCDYGPDYDPGGDLACDGLDNDCDGETDEEALPVAEGEFGDRADDGIDNNCNGLVDEPGGAMVRVPPYNNIWIDVFEATVFDDPGCQGTPYGIEGDDYPAGWPADASAPTTTLYACSLEGVTPSGYLSWYRARRACEAQGKHLCVVDHWGSGCVGGELNFFPYGFTFQPEICNDAISSGGLLLPTGSKEECVSAAGTFDSSGNMGEWVQDWDPEEPGNGMIGGFHYLCEVCDHGLNCRACIPGDEDDRDDVGRASDCYVSGHREESFPLETVKPYLGARCCLEVP